MAQIPRWLLSFVIAILAFIAIVHVTKWPPEVYTPPPMLYANAYKQTHGEITKTESRYLSDHILEGSDIFYYEIYDFQPYLLTVDQTGAKHYTLSPVKYTGEVRVADWMLTPPAIGTVLVVSYDPVDPRINGVPGTLGVWSKTTGYLNPYLWCYVGIIVGAFVIQEIIRIATKTNDLR